LRLRLAQRNFSLPVSSFQFTHPRLVADIGHYHFPTVGLSFDGRILQEDVPFAHPVADYPVCRRPTAVPTFAQKKEVHTEAHLLQSSNLLSMRGSMAALNSVFEELRTILWFGHSDAASACAGLPAGLPR
jgi:hypothetical protein